MQVARDLSIGVLCCYWLNKSGLQVIACASAVQLVLGFLEFAGWRTCTAVCFESLRLPLFLIFFVTTARLGFVEDQESEAAREWRERFRRVFHNGGDQEEPAQGLV